MTEVRHDESELRAGSTLGPYDLLAQIGVGGMARVWAARVRGTSDVVAVKMLLPELAENVEFRKMFFDEARIASRVRHPNVCGTFEMGAEHGTLYLAMEWLDGPSLMRVLRPGREDATECARLPVRPRLAARIIADACAGLHAAHELVDDSGRPLAVVHRDVSPHNLLMTSAGAVKVTDFGVAKALGKSHMTIAGQLKGKVAYMAPEQLTGGDVDRRCDVFALGCVLYEITTGQRPFQGEHDPQVMSAILMGRFEPPGALVRGYPHELSIIVMRALANDPKDRFASAEQMRQALEGYLRNSGPSVGPKQIASLVQERCGEEMAARASAVRGEAAASARNLPAPRDEARPSAGGRPSAPDRGIVGILTAVLLGAVLGMGVLSYVRAARRARTAQATAESAAAAESARAEGDAAGRSPGAGSPSATTSASAAMMTTQGRVHLVITPPTAIIILEGVVLPPGTDMIGKPLDGTSLNVLIRANKHEDARLTIDAATPDEVEITLAPTGAAAPTSSAAGALHPRPRADAAATPLGAPPDIDAPPNPAD